jgi:hypothetical protein
VCLREERALLHDDVDVDHLTRVSPLLVVEQD